MWPLLLAGCASQGPLRPPSLHLPAPVRDLSAERAGTAVTLRWVAPTRTSDGVALGGKHGVGPLTAVLCRVEVAGSACVQVARVPAASGQPGTFKDALSPSLSSGMVRPLTYQVLLVNGKGAGGSPVRVDTLAGTAPPAVVDLRAEPVLGGVALRWRPDPDAGGDRVLLRVVRGAGSDSPPAGIAGRGALLAVEAAGRDAGGATDAGAHPGVAEQYTVTRVRSVRLAGRDLTMSSVPAVFTLPAGARPAPPTAPAGLAAFANTLSGPEVDLSWEMRSDAVAYVIYRSVEAGAFAPLAADGVSALSYSDRDVHAGGHYRYKIASKDQAGQVGPPGGEVAVTVPMP